MKKANFIKINQFLSFVILILLLIQLIHGSFLILIFTLMTTACLIFSQIKNQTYQKELISKLIEAESEIKRAEDSKLGFASIASHQLRTPLTAIKGYLSMIVDETYGKLTPRIKEKMRNVIESNERLIRLVNELLSLSKIETGKSKFEPELLNLEDIIDQIIKDVKIVSDKRGLYLNFSKEKTDLPKILVDEWKIRQVLMNIIDNALKYTKDGGIDIFLKREGNDAKIEICDTGSGIEENELDKIFNIFLRGRAGNQLSNEGSGLGLYIAQKLIEMHQGKIWAESEGKDKGSCFHILIPIKLERNDNDE